MQPRRVALRSDDRTRGTARYNRRRSPQEDADGRAARDPDPQETREWLDALDGVLEAEGPDRAHFLIEQLIDKARRSRRVPAVLGEHRVHQHDPADAQVRMPGDQDDRASHPLVRALERDGDGRAREQAHQRRRPHRELRVGGDALRRRLQPLLARAVATSTAATSCSSRAIRRPGVYARAFLLGPPDRGAARQLPPGSRRHAASRRIRIRG